MTAPYDVIVIGAGAAGIAAGRTLAETHCSFLVLEARGRIGGRAHTIEYGGFGLDLGCGWLHTAERNVWRALAEQAGFALDRSPAPWERLRSGTLLSPERAAFGAAFARFEARIERAANEPHQPASAYLEPGDPANEMIDAICTYLNGARLDHVSAHDYVRYDSDGANQRVVAGYGALISALGAQLPLALETRAQLVDHSGANIRIETDRGALETACVIVTAPTPIIAEEKLRFAPELPAALEAASGLPLGVVDKMFIGFDEPPPPGGFDFPRAPSLTRPSFDFNPMGRPVVEAFYGGPLAEELERADARAAESFIVDELAALLGSAARAKLKPITGSAWGLDQDARGSYSYAKPGLAEARSALAAPQAERIFFAGEALAPAFFGTAHGAAETGIAAARFALDHIRRGRGP